MGPISIPLGAARAGTRLLGGAYRLATLPARTATRLGFDLAEGIVDLLERTSLVEPDASSGTPRLRQEPPASTRRRNGDARALTPIRPSIARSPGARRRASTPGIPGRDAAPPP